MTVTFSHPSEIYAQTSHWRPTNDTSPTPGATPGPAARGLPVAAGAATASTATTASLGRGGSDINLLVLLADVTDDLETDRRQVQRYLEQQQITVLPTQPYPLGRAEFELKLNADLGRAALFVQLLGARPGQRPPDVPDGYGRLQLEVARRHPGVKIMQWRNPDIDLTQIERERHRELLEHETVQATTLERTICEALAPKPPLPSLPAPGDLPLIFLNTERRHSLIANRIRAGLAKRAAWAMPLAKGSSSIVRKDLELNLLACDAMIIVYDDNTEWARAQLLEFRKVARRRERPVRAIPIIDARPKPAAPGVSAAMASLEDDEPEIGIDLPEMVVIDGRAGMERETLDRLSHCLQL